MLSVVIPVFNEERNIVPTYERLEECFQGLGQNCEIIFVNDGSKDNSIVRLVELAEKDKKIKVVNLTRNFGQQIALTAGMHHASGEACITMDCDLQDPPELIPEMVEKMKEGFDIVYARRKGRIDGICKRITAKTYYKLLARISDANMQRNVGDFRLVSRKVLDVLNRIPEKHRYLRGMVSWTGFSEAFVDFDRPNRNYGVSGYTWKKMIRLAMDGILNFSLLPLRLGMYLGAGSILLGCVFLCYMVLDTFINETVYPLYKWLTVVLFVFLGLLFILIWILGEYIGRIYDEQKGRPLYIVDELINFEE